MTSKSETKKNGFKMSPDRPWVKDNTAALVRRFEGANGRSLAVAGEMQQDVAIGDIYITTINKDKGTRRDRSLKRPVIIWGLYRDEKNSVRAVDVLKSTANNVEQGCKLRQLYSDELDITTRYEIALAGSKRKQVIGMGTLHTLPWTSVVKGGSFFDIPGRVGRVDRAIFPHMIVRRHESLLHNPQNDYERHAAIYHEWQYEGLSLPGVEVMTGVVPPEIDPGCKREQVPFNGIHQETVNRLMRWGEKFYENRRQDQRYVRFPHALIPVRQWEGWPEWGNPKPRNSGPRAWDDVRPVDDMGLKFE